jgi:hypothetical protein
MGEGSDLANAGNFWTDAIEADVCKRWIAGESFGLIAKSYEVSRSTIAGKISRLGLLRDPKTPQKQMPYPIRAKKPLAKPKGRPMKPLAPREGPPVPLEALGRSMCRFSTGMLDNGEWGFCGSPTDGGSWCPHHLKIVFVPSRVRAA